MWRQKQAVINSVLATVVINVLALGVSFYTMQVYDRVVPNSAFDTLTVLFVGVCISIALEALMKIVRVRLLDATGKKIELHSIPYSKITHFSVDLISVRPNSVS